MYDVGEYLGRFLEFDDDDPLGWTEFVRMKIWVDIRKPLRRGVLLATGPSSSKWIDMKYERLADFCFYCGRLDHTDRDCNFKEQDQEAEELTVFQYGPWLRATPRKKKPRSSCLKGKKRGSGWIALKVRHLSSVKASMILVLLKNFAGDGVN
uniref:CCHC-type domain-containing protein n=1 Tax=Chenopodium quinoa TaxID=63459 RepID=A0A803L340_CHEQI